MPVSVDASSSIAHLAPSDRAHRLRIVDISAEGRTFRPSDWAERLAGVLASLGPDRGAGRAGAHIGYSPYCVPTVVDGARCVIVNAALRDLEVLARDSVIRFARDNSLVAVET